MGRGDEPYQEYDETGQPVQYDEELGHHVPMPSRNPAHMSTDAMRWSPEAGEHEMDQWQHLFNDRRSEGRRQAPT